MNTISSGRVYCTWRKNGQWRIAGSICWQCWWVSLWWTWIKCTYLNYDKQMYSKMDILHFSDMMCMNLHLWEIKKSITLNVVVAQQSELLGMEQITDDDGNRYQPPTETIVRKHRSLTRSAITAKCFICWTYMLEEGKGNYVQTSFCCKDCKMPL